MQQVGYAVWWDVSDLRGGESWGRTIEAALRASQCCLVLLSPDSVKSEWVEREYMYAMHWGLKIIPLLYRECDVPLALIDKQYLDFQGSNYERGLRQLLAALANKAVPPSWQPGQARWKEKVLVAQRKPLWVGIAAGVFALAALCWVVFALLYPGFLWPSSTATPPHTVTAVVIAPTATPLSTLPPTDTPVPPTGTPLSTLTSTPTTTPTDIPLPPIRLTPHEIKVVVSKVVGAGDVSQEALHLLNQDGVISLKNWKLEGSPVGIITFPDIILFGGGTIRIHTSAGENTPSDLYLDQSEAAWPPGTTIILSNANNVEISRFTVPITPSPS